MHLEMLRQFQVEDDVHTLESVRDQLFQQCADLVQAVCVALDDVVDPIVLERRLPEDRRAAAHRPVPALAAAAPAPAPAPRALRK